MNKGKHAKQKFQVVEIYTVLLLVAFIFMSIGYAQISDIDMIISGQATATAQNGVFIYDVSEAVAGGGAGGGTGGNAAQSTVDTYFSTNLGTTVVLGDSTDSTISYNVSLYNNSNDKYVFVGVEEPVIYNNANKVKNEYITYSLSDKMKAGETIIGHGADDKNLDFIVTFKYKDGVVPDNSADKVLNSLLNFRFRLLPVVSLNGGDEKTVIDSEVCAIYPGFMANEEAYENGYEYQFTVENAASGSYNKVPMKYTLSIDDDVQLPEDNEITESPLIVELCDLEGNLLTFDNAEDGIEIAGDGTTSPLHNYILRVKWNSAEAYNSAKYAGKTFTYKVNFVGTPTVETAKYLGYTHNKSFVVEITTAPLNFNVNMEKADIFMESNGKAGLELAVNNGSNVNYDTAYNVKVEDNADFTPTMSDIANSNVAISDSGILRTLNGGTDKNDNFIIDFAADLNDIDRKEVVNVVLDLKSPYTKEITIPVNIRSIVMSAKNAKDGSVATGTNAQVTNGNVNVTINCDGTYLDSVNNKNLQYAVVEAGGASLSENSWQTIATSEISNLNTTNAEVTKAVSANGNVYARYFDGSTGKGTASILIDNIDKESPNAVSVNQDKITTYSIKVSGSTTDNGSTGTAAQYVNISGYKYQIKNDQDTILASWTPKQESNSYTFIGTKNDAVLQQVSNTEWKIEQGKTYIVSMKAIDLAGNESEETSITVTTGTVAPSNDSTIGVVCDPGGFTKDVPVKVYFTNDSNDEELVVKYQFDSDDGEWLDYPEGGVKVYTNRMVYARLFDKAGQTSETTTTATVDVQTIDRLDPVTATVAESNVEQTTFTLTASGEDAAATDNDACSGIAKYVIYLYDENDVQIGEKEIISTNGTESWNVTLDEVDGDITAGTTYKAKVVVYDKADNDLESSMITFKTKAAALSIVTSGIKVGDFIDYDAGTWNKSTDEALMTKSGGSVSWSASLSKTENQFCGFVDGGDRNKNSTPCYTNYTPFYEGWRVWDINGDIVTLISAGHTETFYFNYDSSGSEKVLQNRDCTMYANGHSYVITEGTYKPHFLTKAELDIWYQANIDSSISNTSRVTLPTATDIPKITLIDIGAFWYLASQYPYDAYLLNYSASWRRIEEKSITAMRCARTGFS